MVEEKEFNLSFKLSDIQLLDEALSQLPYFKVSALIKDINEQLEDQSKERR